MLEILKFIFSSFWIWTGLFLMLLAICVTVTEVSYDFTIGLAKALRGGDQQREEKEAAS